MTLLIPNGLTQEQVDANTQAAADAQVKATAKQQLNDLLSLVINALINQGNVVQTNPSKGVSSTQNTDPLSQWADLYSQAGYE